ncbi:MAG TPA: glycosyltransferase family 2 protein [Thermotogaceae bacterium]|nr:MAG: glycosyltransferase family 2 protein [Bacteroidota bacterium]HEW92132.1 glycosyltransferase family 2 protein [Thermotogaceae bacterium]
MDISIIIPFYQSALLIERCLRSVLSQKGEYFLEIIAVDDGSTDKSAEIITNMNIPNLQLIHQENQGPASARNKGIKASRGKYLAFLDADDYWKPGFLKETIRFLEKNTDAIAVSTGQLHKNPGKPDAISPKILREEHTKPKTSIVLDNFYKFWAEHNHVCTGSVLMRTNVVKRTGGQRSELRITEDLEFWAYLATFGKWGFIPKVLFVSDGGKVSKEQGWIKKNKKRWESAPSIENWEERIIKRINRDNLHSYKIARGRIARNLIYSMIQSNRTQLARSSALRYGDNFPKNKMSTLLKLSSRYTATWEITCELLKLKEKFRLIK